MIEKLKKITLIQRSLGLRHKLKVHDSMKQPETHEDLAIMLNAKWELEDELRAIEEIMAEERAQNVAIKRKALLTGPIKPPPIAPAVIDVAEDDEPTSKKKTKK